ncbi:MAG: thioredoxin domain-containing protein [Caldisericia bacterium]|nr:thioredoxin domain-containing protein [Caldisericia bacterium]MDD5688998.1 thioredoxin domain-containing protein [Caldisericia bacterium]
MKIKELAVKKIFKYVLVCLILITLTSIYVGCSNKISTNTLPPSSTQTNPVETNPSPNPPIVKQPTSTETEKPVTQSFKDYIKSLGKPVIVDFGSTSCIPCKMMEPILEELKLNYSDKFETIFVNVTKDIEKAREFGINVIPTQIFFDEKGEEFYSHIGFFSKEEILNIFHSMGFP